MGLAKRFFGEHSIDVIRVAACTSKDNVMPQRGDGVSSVVIAGLKQLNELGYASRNVARFSERKKR